MRTGPEHDDPATTLRANIAGVVFGLVFIGIGFLLGALLGVRGTALPASALACGVIGGGAVRWVALAVTSGASRGIAAFLFPSGASVPYEATFSAHDALEAAGNVAGAVAAYEDTLQREPGNARALRQAAELHVRAGDPVRAAEIFSELRRISPSREDELYATQRLADLYLGALGDDGRAMVELRRLSERFDGTREGAGAREALRRLKGERGGAPGTGDGTP